MSQACKGPGARGAEALKNSRQQRETNSQELPSKQYRRPVYVSGLRPEPDIDATRRVPLGSADVLTFPIAGRLSISASRATGCVTRRWSADLPMVRPPNKHALLKDAAGNRCALDLIAERTT